MDVVLRFRDALRKQIWEFAHDHPFGIQLYGTLWRFLSTELELDADPGIKGTFPLPGRTLRPAGPGDATVIRETVAMTPPLPRLVYLFWLVTDLDARRLAEMVGLPEQKVRMARAAVTARIQEALAR